MNCILTIPTNQHCWFVIFDTWEGEAPAELLSVVARLGRSLALPNKALDN